MQAHARLKAGATQVKTGLPHWLCGLVFAAIKANGLSPLHLR